MWKNIVEWGRPQSRTRIVCWIRNATNTNSEFVILKALPLQQWLHELDSVLHYTYIACLVVG